MGEEEGGRMVIANALSFMALFIAGAIYVGLKLSQDRKADNRRMIVLGWAAMVGYLIILGMGAHLLMVAAGL